MLSTLVTIFKTLPVLLCAAALMPLTLFSGSPVELAAKSGKGILILHCGSDWSVSGEDVRKVFTSAEFRRAVGKNFVLAVFDDMDNPSEEVKKANDALSPVLVESRRYPAITCITPRPHRFFAQLENIPRSVTAEKLALVVNRASGAKDSAEALFRKAAGDEKSDPERAVDAYGKGFDLLVRQAGEFTAASVYKGSLAYEKEWNRLLDIDKDDRHGWRLRFTMGDGVDLVEKATKYREKGEIASGEEFLAKLKALPQEHLFNTQKQIVKMAEYAFYRGDSSREAENVKLLEEALAIDRDTIWGQCAMGYLILSGKKIERKKPYRAPVRERSSSASAMSAPFPLESVKRSLSRVTPDTKLTESIKLNIARYAALRRIGDRGWKELSRRRGSSKFAAAFLKDRSWLEDFAWSGPCDGYNAILALESVFFQDDGRWVKTLDCAGRRFATALALEYSSHDEAYLTDYLDAYRTTWEEGRLHRHALIQPVWQWRFAIHQGQPSASCDYAPAQQRYLSKYVNMPERKYGSACWLVPYRLFNCFGESVHGPQYYAPWEAAGEWPKRRYSPIVGGVCGELSKFGSACANSHGLPSCTAGQPVHCAYTRRRLDGQWEINYSVTYPTHIQLKFWERNIWPYVTALEGTFTGNREKRLDADRYIELALLSAERADKAKTVEEFYRQACRSWPSHYNAWREYGEWVNNSGASLDTMRIWARGCLRGMRSGRQPVWDFVTPYFTRLMKEKGQEALVDILVRFAPYFRQSDVKIQEEADFKEQLKKWTQDITDKPLLVSVFKAMLAAQYGTRDYFSQTLSWGGEVLMADGADPSVFIETIEAVVAEKVKKGEKPSLDFNPLILEASKSGNFPAFRQLAQLQERLDPFKRPGKKYPMKDFGAPLMSREGMLKTSTTSNWDSPAKYARIIDETPTDDNGFHTDKEDAPWACVVLPGPVELKGVVIENRCAAQNMGRQVPLQIQVSDDGETWRTVYTESEILQTYRADFRRAALRAKFVRVQRIPGEKNDFFHFTKILVYGKKLY